MELLVSAAILSLVMLLLLQLLRGVTGTIASNRGHMDADAVARMVFDRMASDFDSMIKRKDVDVVCSNAAGNDSLFFFSQAPAYFAAGSNNSPIALVGYRINSNSPYCANAPALERLGKGLLRDGTGSSPGSMTFLAFPDANSTNPVAESTMAGHWPDLLAPGSADSAYRVLASQVFRLEFLYLLKPYRQTNGTAVPTKYSLIPYNETHSSVNGFQDVSAIVATIAVLDETSHKIIQDVAGGVMAMGNKLEDPTSSEIAGSPPLLPAQKWRAATLSGGFAPQGVPKAAANQVRVYQRHFYLK